MKIKEGYVLRKVAQQYIVVCDKSVDFKKRSIFVLNETSAFLWEQMLSDTDEEKLICALMSEYDTNEKQAGEDIKELLARMREAGLLEEA